MTSLRRYAPFALLVATQMVLVLVAPSHGANTGPSLGGTFGGNNAAANSTGAGGTTAAGSVGGATGLPGSGGSANGTGVGTTAAGGGAGGVQAAASGSFTKQKFCITGLLDHLPCMAKWSGGDNGGATSMGVTGKTVTVVMYRAKDNAAVDAILQETGTYTSPQDEQTMLGVVQKWINSHYQLYGRQIQFKYVQGTCDIAPPVDSCFTSEADKIAAQYHPFALFWTGDTNEAAFFSELAHKGVITWGGWNFTDKFDDSLRPYHYDVFMGGDTQAEIAGQWYCNRLANKKARFAGDATLQAQQRKVAVVHADTSEVDPSAALLESIIKKCDKNGAIDAKYSSDTSTAAQQSTTDTSTYKSEGVTTLIWFSDVIAPAYATKAEAAQQWHPEEVLAGEGLLDYDALAQTYDSTEWAHAFGPSDLAESIPVTETDAGHVWKEAGESGSPNANSNLMTAYMLSVAGGIMAAGPKLTPLTYEYGQLTTPGYDGWQQWHDPRLSYVKYGRGDYTGVSDIREVYYDPNKTSPTNGKAGAYVPLNGGRRYQLGDIPTGEPNLPSSV